MRRIQSKDHVATAKINLYLQKSVPCTYPNFAVWPGSAFRSALMNNFFVTLHLVMTISNAPGLIL